MNNDLPPMSDGDAPRLAVKPRLCPQGTQLLSTEELQRFAQAEVAVSDGRASTQEPVLEGLSEAIRGRRFSLRSGRQTVGRRADNDVVIDDSSVSAAHAWIINQHGHYVVMNTLSTNGTFVNDKRIHESALAHGDRVRFGQVEFRFLTRESSVVGLERFRWVAVAVLGGCVLIGLAWWLL